MHAISILRAVLKWPFNRCYDLLSRLMLRLAPGYQASLAVKTWPSLLFDENRDGLAEPIENLLAELKRGLDAESVREIDRYFQRVVFATHASKAGVLCSPEAWIRLLDPQELSMAEKLPPVHAHPFPSSRYLDITDNGILFLPATIREKIKGNDVIDGGAYIGDSIRSLVRYEPGHIFAFEPSEGNLAELRENSRRYAWKNVIPVKKGLGAKKGTGEVTSKTQIASSAQVSSSQDHRELKNKRGIEITDIDSFVEENSLSLALVKLDVEGLEYDVVLGAANSIKKHRPILLLSIYHNPKDFFKIKPLIESWNLGYQFQVRKLHPLHPFSETMLIAHVMEENH